MEEILALNAALTFIQKMIPLVAQAVADGQVSIEAQSELRARYSALRAKADAAFTGPEWDLK